MYGTLNSQFNEIKVLYTQVCGMQNSWPTADLPVSRNSQVHRQNFMELVWFGPSTVRNPSAETLIVQRSQKNIVPECISAIAFLDATTCLTISLSQDIKHFGTCFHPPSYQSLHCLKSESFYCVTCCFRLLVQQEIHTFGSPYPVLDITAFQGTNTSLNPIKTSFLQFRTF